MYTEAEGNIEPPRNKTLPMQNVFNTHFNNLFLVLLYKPVVF